MESETIWDFNGRQLIVDEKDNLFLLKDGKPIYRIYPFMDWVRTTARSSHSTSFEVMRGLVEHDDHFHNEKLSDLAEWMEEQYEASTSDNFNLVCQQCGHEWVRRGKLLPKVCPKCKSRKWNVS